MKILIVLFLLVGTQSCFTQIWQHIDSDNYTMDFTVNTGFSASPMYNKNFKIDRSTNSLWFTNQWGSEYSVRELDNNGDLFFYNSTTVPLFNSMTKFTDLAFTPNRTFVINEDAGLYSYNGVSWSLVIGILDGKSVFAEGDTVWMPNSSGNYYKWSAGVSSIGNHSFGRICSRKGETWVSTNYVTVIAKYNDVNGMDVYSPDTTLLSSWNNFDFKFARNKDTLYLANERGLFLAYNDVFFDSITIDNTTNMPSAGIIEFEFDSNDNIWAVFASDLIPSILPTGIGYYDQSLQDWTMIYNNGNSPISFSDHVTIEIDSADNVWVATEGDLYVLKLSNWPNWLSIEEPKENQRSLLKIVDMLGRETEFRPNIPLIYIYSDGTTKRVLSFNSTNVN